jgi:glutamate-1-semialdehyde 2,1-aminomutase
LCDQYEILLIFDEVLCGFRTALGGAREIYGVVADLTCLGKVVGGGLPVGVYGGRREIMDLVAPLGGVYQAGTLSGNPIAMAAGLATLTELEKPKTQLIIKERSAQLNAGLNELKSKVPGLKMQVNQSGSLFGFFFNEKRVTNFIDAKQTNTVLFKKFYQAMLLQGVYLAPSAFEAGFISSAHSAKDIDYTLKHFYEILRGLS